MEPKDIFNRIDGSREDIIRDVSKLVSIPGIGPANDGTGESERADWIEGYLRDLDFFDSVERMDVQDEDVLRSNVIALKKGKKKGTVWLIAHMDTVHPGDPLLWNHPPFEAFVEGDKIYGLGSEDNGQGLIAALYSVRFIGDVELQGYSIGLAFVADEETGSNYGVIHLLDKGVFSKDDFILVPDWGSPNGEFIDISEKNILWLKITVEGIQVHGSTPDKGLNAYRIGARFLTDLIDGLYERYNDKDPIFRPTGSTFEPTRRSVTTDNINVIPGRDEFWMDCRILPGYDLEDIISYVKDVAEERSKRTGAKISVDVVQRLASGPSSSTGTYEYDSLKRSISEITGRMVKEAGIGGGTCANFFRKKGINAYAWSSEGDSLHKPNEYVLISNIMTDAKVFFRLFNELCINNH